MDKDLLKTLSVIDEHNSDACFLSENALSNFTECYDTGCYALNAILTGDLRNGGVPQGRIIGFSGESGTGKTLITGKILANAQKKGVIPVIFDSEIAVDKNSVRGVGLDPEKVKYVPIDTIEKCRNQVGALLDKVIANKQHGKIIICIDSLGNLASQKELDDALKDKSAVDMGMRAKALKSMLRTLTYKAAKAQVSIIFVNHTYSDPAAMYPSLIKSQAGGSGPVYMASILVQLAKRNEKAGEGEFGNVEDNKLSEANKYSGVTLRALTAKNRFIPQFLEIEMYLSFKSGLNKYSGLLAMATARGIVEQNGATYTVGVDGGKYKKGDKLGYAKNFTKDASFYEEFIIPALDKALKTDYRYHQASDDLVDDVVEQDAE
jgi:RecA/RadA recombinase